MSVGKLNFGLSSRHYGLLQLLVEEKSMKEIASELRISKSAVKQHFTALYSLLGVHGQVGAAVWATEHGIKARGRKAA